MTDLDWSAFEDELIDTIVNAVLAAAEREPHERFTAAALDHLYRETDGPICLPWLAIGTADEVTADGWSPADWDRYDVPWLTPRARADWERRLSAYACRGSRSDWTALDYRPLAAFIEQHPEHVVGVAEELKPGSGYCTMTVDELSEALRGLSSPHVIIRRHAAVVLGDRGLGTEAAAAILPRLSNTATGDADATTRRLSVRSLCWWRNDSLPYIATAHAALNDRDPGVRQAGEHWLRSQATNPRDR